MFSLADAIITQNINAVRHYLPHITNIDEMDEYGFTYLIEACITNNLEIAKLCCDHGADPNAPDVNGNTPLHWAVENNHLQLCQLLLDSGANPNAYNVSGQPVLVTPMLRHQQETQKLLYKYGASCDFAKDFINAKLMGHIFDLVGTTNIAIPGGSFVEVDFEGFYVDIALGLIGESLLSCSTNFAGRKLRSYASLTKKIIGLLQRGAILTKYRQYQTNWRLHQAQLRELITEEPLLIALGYEGHAISFIKYGNLFVKCDRRITEDNPHTVTIFRMHNQSACDEELIYHLLYNRHNGVFINQELSKILALEPLHFLPINAQISGNCSWANIEAAIPSILFLLLNDSQHELNQQKLASNQKIALEFFQHWRQWNQKQSIDFCLNACAGMDQIRQATKAEMLAAVLFQRYKDDEIEHKHIIKKIITLLRKEQFKYILENYLKIYYYQSYTHEGEILAELLKRHHLINYR